MNTNRSIQLVKLRALYELRERDALAKLTEQQKCVDALKVTAHDIQLCIDEFENQLTALDDRRLFDSDLTVIMLQDHAANRLVVNRDLGKERIYLKTANNDICEAMAELDVIRAQWRECSRRLDAIAALEKDQKKIETQLSQLVADRELDDFALTRHGVLEHG